MVTTQEVVQLFRHDDELDAELPTQRAVTVRMDVDRLAYIDSMAEQARVSRNLMVNHLLGLGMKNVLDALADSSPEIVDAIQSGIADHIEV